MDIFCSIPAREPGIRGKKTQKTTLFSIYFQKFYVSYSFHAKGRVGTFTDLLHELRSRTRAGRGAPLPS
jgi:hypothetical protein